MKFRWLILVVCLTAVTFATSSDAPAEDTPAPGGQTSAPVEDTPAPGGQTDAPGGGTPAPGGDTPAPGGNTAAPGGNTPAPGGQTSAPGGDTPAPGGNTPAPGGQTSAPGGDTPAPGGDTPAPGGDTSSPDQPSTVIQPITTTQPQGSTLPNVNVDHVQFKIDSCAKGVCTYTYLAPQNDQTVLTQDQAIITVDRDEYNQAKANVANFSASIGSATDPATAKVNDLNTQLEKAKKQLAAMQEQLKNILTNTQSATKSLDKATYFMNNFLDNDCFNSCVNKRPTSPPTTTPTTPVPTTTEDLCVTFCESAPVNNCSRNNPRQEPFCNGCGGNLDGYAACAKSDCVPFSSVFPTAGYGIFKSPDYNDTVGKDGCYWDYPASSLGYQLSYNDTSIKKISLPPSVTVSLNPYDTDYPSIPIKDGTSLSRLNTQISGKCNEGFSFQLQVGAGTPQDFSFEWMFEPAIKPTPSS